MTDLCFICRENSNNRVCPCCNVYAHPTCWKTYFDTEAPLLFRGEVMVTEDGVMSTSVFLCPTGVDCPVCKYNIPQHRYMTRSQTRENREFLSTIILKGFLDLMGDEDDRAVKFQFCKKMHEYLVKNPMILKHHKKFSAIVQYKLHNLHFRENWELASYFHYRLFGKGIY